MSYSFRPILLHGSALSFTTIHSLSTSFIFIFFALYQVGRAKDERRVGDDTEGNFTDSWQDLPEDGMVIFHSTSCKREWVLFYFLIDFHISTHDRTHLRALLFFIVQAE